MKKITGLARVAILIAFVACNTEMNDLAEAQSQRVCGCPDNTWLKNMIDALAANTMQQAKITRYWYHNETVYLVDSCIGCADAMQILYSCSGEQRCTFGGIAGLDTCPDFAEQATRKKDVWHN